MVILRKELALFFSVKKDYDLLHGLNVTGLCINSLPPSPDLAGTTTAVLEGRGWSAERFKAFRVASVRVEC